MPGKDSSESMAPVAPMAEDPDDAALRDDPDAAVMARNGITRVTVHQYHVDGYRYSSLRDAMAQVGRGAEARGTGR